jgi:translin
MDKLPLLADQIHQAFEIRTRARDQALSRARTLTRHCAHAIRAIHRDEEELASEQLAAARSIVASLKEDLSEFPDLFYAGYTQDAIKEFAEASITCALILNDELPTPEELGTEYATYLNGLAESVGEMRRRCLDILRHGYSEEAERLLAYMDEIYAVLVTMDYPDAITSNLRRHTDLVRGIVERTRGDMTLALRENRMVQAISEALARLPENGAPED